MNNKSFPTIQLTSQQIAQIKEWAIGGQYTLEITVELTGKRQAESFDIPTHEIGEGQMPKGSDVVGSFTIKDVQVCCDDEEDDEDMLDPMDTYEDEYAQKMSGKNKTDSQVYNS